MHGGRAPQVVKTARERLEAGVDPSIDALLEALAQSKDYGAKVRAAKEFLDRAGYGKVAPKADTGLSLYELLGRIDPEEPPLTFDALQPAAMLGLKLAIERGNVSEVLKAAGIVLNRPGAPASGRTLEEILNASYSLDSREQSRVAQLAPAAVVAECAARHDGACLTLSDHAGRCADDRRAAGETDGPEPWGATVGRLERRLDREEREQRARGELQPEDSYRV